MERRGFLEFCLTAGIGQSITPSISAAQASSGAPVPSQPRTLTEADAQAVRDTVIKLENAMNLAVDALDCGVGMASVGDQEPITLRKQRVEVLAIVPKAEAQAWLEQEGTPGAGGGSGAG